MTIPIVPRPTHSPILRKIDILRRPWLQRWNGLIFSSAEKIGHSTP